MRFLSRSPCAGLDPSRPDPGRAQVSPVLPANEDCPICEVTGHGHPCPGARGLPLVALTMHGLPGVFWLHGGGTAVYQVAAGHLEEGDPLQPAWEPLALACTVVLLLGLLLCALRQLGKMPGSGAVEEAQEPAPADPEDLESRLASALSQMEQEIVKLMTLVHKRKAGLLVRHRSCRMAECQQAKGRSGAFNLAVYDIVES